MNNSLLLKAANKDGSDVKFSEREDMTKTYSMCSSSSSSSSSNLPKTTHSHVGDFSVVDGKLMICTLDDKDIPADAIETGCITTNLIDMDALAECNHVHTRGS